MHIPPFSTLAIYSPIQRPKQKRQLPKELSENALNMYRMSLVLVVELSITGTSKLHSVNTLLDYRATRSFINHNLVYSKGINTWTISHPIPVFNVDSSPNKASQILEVVDIVLYYWTHLKQMLLAISSPGKQKLILDYTWLKNYNPKVNWEKGEVYIT